MRSPFVECCEVFKTSDWIVVSLFFFLREAMSNYLVLSSFLIFFSYSLPTYFCTKASSAFTYFLVGPIISSTSSGGSVRREVVYLEFLVLLMSVTTAVSKLTSVISITVSLKCLIYVLILSHPSYLTFINWTDYFFPFLVTTNCWMNNRDSCLKLAILHGFKELYHSSVAFFKVRLKAR